jgi:hypothetical protein
MIRQLKKMTPFLDIVPCSLVEVDRRFRGVFCHHRPDRGSVHVWNVSLLQRDCKSYIPECCHLQSRRRDNLKSHKAVKPCIILSKFHGLVALCLAPINVWIRTNVIASDSNSQAWWSWQFPTGKCMTHILQFLEHKLWLKEMLSFECHRHRRAVEAKLETYWQQFSREISRFSLFQPLAFYVPAIQNCVDIHINFSFRMKLCARNVLLYTGNHKTPIYSHRFSCSIQGLTTNHFYWDNNSMCNCTNKYKVEAVTMKYAYGW